MRKKIARSPAALLGLGLLGFLEGSLLEHLLSWHHLGLFEAAAVLATRFAPGLFHPAHRARGRF